MLLPALFTLVQHSGRVPGIRLLQHRKQRISRQQLGKPISILLCFWMQMRHYKPIVRKADSQTVSLKPLAFLPLTQKYLQATHTWKFVTFLRMPLEKKYKVVDLRPTKTDGFGWKKKIYKQSITSIPELKEAIKKLWVQGNQYLRSLVKSMPRKIADVIEKAGYLTKY